jgi:TusE/DsrC/DsvC family sulfur relay protein
MTTTKIAGKELELDADGHLAHAGDWNEEIARGLAKKEGIETLNEDHWKVINFMRAVFSEKGDAPSIRRLTKESGVDTKLLYQLFPKGPAKKAARIAGLPKPKGCI